MAMSIRDDTVKGPSGGEKPGTGTEFFRHPGRHRVAVLVRDESLPIELGIVHQLFGHARSADDDRPLYEVVTCALRPGELGTDGDFRLLIGHGPAALAHADTVIVLSSYADYRQAEARPAPELTEAFALIRPDARIASICTGAFVLAAAGLLDGHRATTHWRHTERFRRLFPRVALDPDVLYTDSLYTDPAAGHRRVLTSAGCAAGIDLCLHMIRTDHGAAVTNDVARRAVVPPHRDGGQAQFIRQPVPAARRSGTSAARAWALGELHRPITLREMADRESMSVRTFSRRFREETGTTPVRWLIRQRVERARELLEETDLPVDRVAERSGFGTATALRQQLHAALGVSPSAYRSTFRGPEAGAVPRRPDAVPAADVRAADEAGREPAADALA